MTTKVKETKSKVKNGERTPIVGFYLYNLRVLILPYI
ncbi:hypothetical protein JEFDOCMN_00198 [Enterococcus phage vB_OCPT_CCS1]|uniref:Uncharacterized protein n=1 Tax=Enterococcus phage vB_OCPT_CCS1 TaxID=2922323 RepID=A0A9E7DV11_9CAUD|nr:hypothetical protein JEFDOCMN_00198 [Enterococcus phage vB_OCPT_CCS1]